MRILTKIFLFILWPILLGAKTQPPLPTISSPVEEGFFTGSVGEIKEFIEKKQQEIQSVLTYLQTLLKEKEISPANKTTLKTAIELLNILPWQFKKIINKLSTPSVSVNIVLPTLKGPPYNLQEYYQLLNTYQAIITQTEEVKHQLTLTQRELTFLNNDLKHLFGDYTELLNQRQLANFYLVYAQMLSMQTRYALKKISTAQLEKALDRLEETKTRCLEKMTLVFKHLNITSADLKKAKSLAQQAQKEEERKKAKIEREIEQIERNLVFVEMKIDEISQQLNLKQSVKVLSLIKQQYEMRRLCLQVTKEKLENELLLTHIKTQKLLFRTQWLQLYTGRGKLDKSKVFLNWTDMAESWQRVQDRFNTLLAQTQLRANLINEKLTAVRQIKETEKSSQKVITNFIVEGKRTLRVLNSYMTFLQKANKDLKATILEINLTIELLKAHIHIWEKVSFWFKEKGVKTWKRIKSVLYYPLFTIGTTPFSCATLIKFLLTVSIGIYLLRWFKRRLLRALQKMPDFYSSSVNSVITLVYYIGIAIILTVSLSVVGINLKQLTILFGALGVGIGFGLQTVTNNFISGIILLFERAIKVGDIVEVGENLAGVVRRINIRSTVIRTYDGLDVIVPNSEFIANRVTTWTYDDDWRRLQIPFGVAYGSNVDLVAELAAQAARSLPYTQEDRTHKLNVVFTGFGDSSLDFRLIVWCRMYKLDKTIKEVISEYYFALYKAFTKAGIEIPFPQRDLHIRSFSEETIKKIVECSKKGNN